MDKDTREQLDHILTVHFRGRYAAVDVTTLSPEHEDMAIGTNNFKATVHLHHHMAHLYEQYVTMCWRHHAGIWSHADVQDQGMQCIHQYTNVPTCWLYPSHYVCIQVLAAGAILCDQ